MLLVRLLVGVMWVLAAVAGHQMWTPEVSAVHQPAARSETTAISIPMAVDAPDVPTVPEPGARPRFDVYGNQVDEAVGDYRIDPQGDVYEWHSPDTALLELGPPGA
jgi:hypothetical protein